jgi:hypothetical protein
MSTSHPEVSLLVEQLLYDHEVMHGQLQEPNIDKTHMAND